MGVVNTTYTFANNDVVTSTRMNNIIGDTTFTSDALVNGNATLEVSGGKLRVRSGGITSNELASNSVVTSKITDLNVTTGKLADLSVTTAKINDASVTAAKIAADSVAWTNTLPADRAVQADVQSQSASHFVSPDVMKFHPGVSLAGGVLTMATGGIVGSHGVNTTATGSGTLRTVTLSSAMANTNYRVQISQEDASTTANAPVITAKTTTTFTVASGATKIVFDVFGQIA